MCRVLLIDDMKTLTMLVKRDLTREGYTVFTASSGSEGLEIFRREPTDAVVSDLTMEGMNGLQISEAVRDICNDRGLPKTPFILLTGYDSELTDENDLARRGVDRVILKPVDLEVLRNCLAEVMGRGAIRPS
jgi:CheY-like chemotaxis protein